MALPVPEAGRQGLLSFRLFGFPVTIHASFVVIVLAFGLLSVPLVEAVVWLVVVTVSVIAHELGHAAVAAPAGGEPRIDLYGLAGLTRWNPGRSGRGRRVAVSLAGPGAGVLFGLLVLAVGTAVDPEPGTLTEFAFERAIFANMLWGLVNLLPMLPLDGGQVVFALMPGRDETVRLKRAAYLSLGIAVAVALAVVRIDQIAAILVVFFGAGNVQTLMALRRAERPDPLAKALSEVEGAVIADRPEDALRLLPHESVVPPGQRGDVVMLKAMALLRLGRAREAQDLLNDAGGRVEPTFAAAVLLANGQERLAREHLATTLRQDPPEWAVRELVALLVRRGDDVDEVLGSDTGLAVASGAMVGLYFAGRHADAGRWGDRAIVLGAGAGVAYNTACAWALAGDSARALRALDHAALMGWPDLDHVERDGDLAAVRALPGYAAVAERIRGNAGTGLGHPSHHG